MRRNWKSQLLLLRNASPPSSHLFETISVVLSYGISITVHNANDSRAVFIRHQSNTTRLPCHRLNGTGKTVLIIHICRRNFILLPYWNIVRVAEQTIIFRVIPIVIQDPIEHQCLEEVRSFRIHTADATEPTGTQKSLERVNLPFINMSVPFHWSFDARRIKRLQINLSI